MTLPIEKGEEIGGVQLTFDNEVLKSIPVIAANSVADVSTGSEEETELAGFPWMLVVHQLVGRFLVFTLFQKAVETETTRACPFPRLPLLPRLARKAHRNSIN